MVYDESPNSRVTIASLEDLHVYVKQNEDDEVRRRRHVRQALRALDVGVADCLFSSE